MQSNIHNQSSPSSTSELDQHLSNRYIELDPKGYFLIKVDHSAKELVAELYSNDIDNKGRAVDPKTGKPISCDNKTPRTALKTFRGRSAKELGIQITEGEAPFQISRLDHALYLGRELQKAESCMLNGIAYIQD